MFASGTHFSSNDPLERYPDTFYDYPHTYWNYQTEHFYNKDILWLLISYSAAGHFTPSKKALIRCSPLLHYIQPAHIIPPESSVKGISKRQAFKTLAGYNKTITTDEKLRKDFLSA